MCITIGPAKLSKTKILSLVQNDGNHLLAYSNKVKNLSPGTNAMILPVPGILNKDWFYDTTEYNDFLKDIEEEIKPKSRGLKTKSLGQNTLSVEEFSLGMYKVYISSNLILIKDILNNLPQEDKPNISDDLFNFFAEHYKDWSFVVCCFDGTKEVDAQPIMFEYKPFFADYLYFPGMDSHNGLAPKLNAQTSVDHCLMVENIDMYRYNYEPENFFTQKGNVPKFLIKHYGGTTVTGSMLNGDWYVNIRELNSGKINFIRSPKHLAV